MFKESIISAALFSCVFVYGAESDDFLKNISQELFQETHRHGSIGIINVFNKNKLNKKDKATVLRFAAQLAEKKQAKITSKLFERVHDKITRYNDEHSKKSLLSKTGKYFYKGMIEGLGQKVGLLCFGVTITISTLPLWILVAAAAVD